MLKPSNNLQLDESSCNSVQMNKQKTEVSLNSTDFRKSTIPVEYRN